jgi:hypothetical protein
MTRNRVFWQRFSKIVIVVCWGKQIRPLAEKGMESFLVACMDMCIGVYCRCIPSLEADKAMYTSKEDGLRTM